MPQRRANHQHVHMCSKNKTSINYALQAYRLLTALWYCLIRVRMCTRQATEAIGSPSLFAREQYSDPR